MNTPQPIPYLTRLAAMVAAGVLVTAGGALAHGNHDHGADRGSDHQMKSRDSGRDGGDKHSLLKDVRKDKSASSDKHKDRDAKRAEKKQEREAKHAAKQAEREAKRAERMKEKKAKQAEKDKDKTTGTATTADGDLLGKGIAGRKGLDGQSNAGSAASGTVTGPGAGNTVHPIPGSAAASTVTGPGAGNTVHPISGSSAGAAVAVKPPNPKGGVVTVSDGKGNSFIIPDHGGGVAVTSSRPGSITINNGAETRTLSGSYKLTISGARTVSVDKGIQVAPQQADGSTVIIAPLGTVTNNDPIGDGLDALKTTYGAIAGHLDPRP